MENRAATLTTHSQKYAGFVRSDSHVRAAIQQLFQGGRDNHPAKSG